MRKRHLTPAQVFKTPFWSQVRHFFGLYTGHDTNMVDARKIGLELNPMFTTPDAMVSDGMWLVRDAVESVEEKVLGPIMRGADAEATFRDSPALLGVSRREAGQRLRMWSGCISAAKTIAVGTRSGRNWPWWRRRIARLIQAEAEGDLFYASGVSAAVAFKMGRDEPFSFFGIPSSSLMRRGLKARLGRLPEGTVREVWTTSDDDGSVPDGKEDPPVPGVPVRPGSP